MTGSIISEIIAITEKRIFSSELYRYTTNCHQSGTMKAGIAIIFLFTILAYSLLISRKEGILVRAFPEAPGAYLKGFSCRAGLKFKSSIFGIIGVIPAQIKLRRVLFERGSSLSDVLRRGTFR